MNKSTIWKRALWWAMVCGQSQAPLEQVLGASLGCAVWRTELPNLGIRDGIAGAVPWAGGVVVNILTAPRSMYGRLADIVFVHEVAHIVLRHQKEGHLSVAADESDPVDAAADEFVKAFLLKYDYLSKGFVCADDLYTAMNQLAPCDKEQFMKDVAEIERLWRSMDGNQGTA